jgi:hypothetical protein
LIDSLDQKCTSGDDELKDLIEAMGTGAPVEIKRSDTPKSIVPRGPWENITQEDIDKWNGNLHSTQSLTVSLEKVSKQILDLQRKQSEFALKDDLLKTQNDLRNTADEVKNNKEDIETINKEIEKIKAFLEGLKFPSLDEFNLLRSRVDGLEN